MKEQNLFQPVNSIQLYNDSIGHVTLYDASHANESEAQRIWTVTQICSLAYGNEEAKNPEALYERMKSIKHESLWEFIRQGNANFCDVKGSMRGSPGFYERNYSVDPKTHKSMIACFRIKVPIFVARQFMRHRSFSYLEMSRRYTKDSKVPFEFWAPDGYIPPIMDYLNEYRLLVESGLHTQVASRFLPQTTYTEYFIMGEVEGLRNFFTLRCAKEAQEEIREVAMAMLKLISKHQPELYKKVLP